MTAIAVDLGDKRCGIAIEINGISIAKEIAVRHKIINTLKKYFIEYQSIDTIVVGLPYDLYNKKLKQLGKTHKFIKKLEKIFPEKEVIGVDERFSSFGADVVLQEMGIQKNRDHRDDISAQIILESYISQKNT